MRFALPCLLICLVSQSAPAATAVITAGLGTGGGNLSEITGNQNYNISAGSGYHVLVGLILPVTPTALHRFEIQGNVGYLSQGDTKDGDSNAATWSRYPLELIYYYRNTQEDFRIGYGTIYHVLNHLNGRGTRAAITSDFDNALGWTFHVEKIFGSPEDRPRFAFGLKSNFIRYHSSRFNTDADGNALFATASLLWF
jgi:hypothetical protein